ncbi:MAG: PucR family transcriptional regulator ligand-binding domain-containing protein, partial [Clostridia bacterium]|nr:PucR family transcriptional regulator ligand-binding domain-containing protein [Clostridia bacterium]
MAVLLSSIYSRLKSTDGQQIRLVTGEKGLNNVVRWVHIVEVDELISFLEGNELIFVTGIAIKNEEDLNSLAEKIFENKASGLVINIGPYIKEIPESIIRFCSK